MIYLELSLIFLVGTAVTLTAFMTIYLMIRRNRRIKYGKWNLMADLLIRKAIFFEEDQSGPEARIPVTSRMDKLLANARFRRLLTKKIISAARSLSGQSSANLQRLYIQLELDQFALKMIGSSEWHKKAQAIQQLGVVGLTPHLKTVYGYTNDKNELIRIEAQLAVLKLHGFEGLRFLDVVSYKISEWQQILLLKELSLLPHTNLKGIDQWLRSSNSSVVIFALKLARNYHHYELYDVILSCLDHPEAAVRVQAIYTLTEIFTEETAAHMIKLLPKEAHQIQLAIVKALMKIGSEAEIAVLLSFLTYPDFDLKLALVRTIAHLGGMQELNNHPAANNYPLNEMIAQIKSEMK